MPQNRSTNVGATIRGGRACLGGHTDSGARKGNWKAIKSFILVRPSRSFGFELSPSSQTESNHVASSKSLWFRRAKLIFFEKPETGNALDYHFLLGNMNNSVDFNRDRAARNRASSRHALLACQRLRSKTSSYSMSSQTKTPKIESR